MPIFLVPIPSTVVLRRHNQTSTLLRPPIYRLNDINKLLLILQHPVQLVIISRSKITHHVFVTEEEHDSARIVQLVHGLEIGDFVEIAEVDGAKVLYTVDLVEYLVLRHAVGVRVPAEADQN